MLLGSSKMPRTGKRKQPKKAVQNSNEARQLEAEVHTSLPPLVKGVLRGHVRVCVGRILWEYSIGPPSQKLCIRLKWWGEQSPGTTFRVPLQVGVSSKPPLGNSTTLAYFPVRSGLSQLKAYLKDMGSLLLHVGLGHMTDDSVVIGQSTIPDLANLTAATPIEGSYPIVNTDGICFGRLQVRVSLEVSESTGKPTREVVPSKPEFTVGPGARAKRKGSPEKPEFTVGPSARTRRKSSPEKDVDTIIGCLNSGLKRAAVGQSERQTDSMEGVIHVPFGKSTDELVPQTTNPGRQQVEVISDLIEKGRKLRDAMLQSMLEPSVAMTRKPSTTTTMQESTIDPSMVSTEIAQRAKPTNSRKGTRVAKRKEKINGGGLVSSNQEIVDLLVGEEADVDLNGVYVDFSSSSSSEEEDTMEDFSMNESDYPLHNDSLLQKLLYSDGGDIPEGGDDHTEALSSLTEDPGNMRVQPQQDSKDTHGGLPPSRIQREDIPPPNDTDPDSKHTHPAYDHASLSSKAPSSYQASETSSLIQPHKATGSGGKADTDSWSTVSSFFGTQDKSLESVILHSIGMEKLTKLGRVTSARVTVEDLQLDSSAAVHFLQRKRINSRMPQPITTSASPTYFVEYQFPAVIHRPEPKRRGETRLPYLPSHEVMRIASKRMKDGTTSFNHRSVFPVVFNSSVIRHWWNGSLTFRVYCRPPSDRMPFLVGKAVTPLRKWLEAHSFSSQCRLAVRTSTLADAAKGISDNDPSIGTLQVSFQLVVGKKQQAVFPEIHSPAEKHSKPPPVEDVTSHPSEGQGPHPAIRLKEKVLNHKDLTEKKPSPLQLLLLLPEGTDVTVPANGKGGSPSQLVLHHGGTPNCYLVCKLFCASPHPKTPVQWASSSPQFGFKQVYLLYLTPALLEQVCNNFTVIEVWHKTPGTTTEDELIGLVKLSLHQFFLAFSEQSSAELCQEAELPVIAVDSYCPIVSPFTGIQNGYLAVLLALGTGNQVTLLQQQFAAGSYLLQQPHCQRHSLTSRLQIQVHSHKEQSTSEARPEICEGQVHHMFDVTVDGVRGLSAFNNTVWGEADCFVQYHFPTASELEDDLEQGPNITPDVCLQPCRTGTTLCVPDPAFNHRTNHTLILPGSCPVQKEIMSACGSGGVPFELWRRFYYPNIRDQLIAKGSLPLAKLCAMVTMQRMTVPNVQSFSLPLKLLTEDPKGESGGLLDITVKYETFSEAGTLHETEDGFEKTHVNLSVGVLRAAGLKDAAVLASSDHPVPLGFAAEVGTNAYATISIPSLPEQERRTTKTIARSFAPEFSHFFDLSLPLVLDKSPRRRHPSSTRVSLAEKLATSLAVIEIWHQVPKRDTCTRPLPGDGRIFGRRLGPTFKDILLGYVEIPLVQLLQRQTGVHGWFALCSPESSHIGYSEPKEPTLYPHKCIAGIELSFSFANADDRKLIISRGLKMGWKAPFNCHIDSPSLVSTEIGVTREPGLSLEGKQWKFEVKVTGVWVSLDSVAIPTARDPAYKYCFVRYRFFEKNPVVTAPKAVTHSRDGMAYYHLKHTAQLCTQGSPQLKWYLNEEALEVQVWASIFEKRSTAHRPQSEDCLLGFAHVPLQSLKDITKNEVQISGCYPLFKPGVDSQGSQTLHVEIQRSELENISQDLEENTTIEVLDSSVGEESPQTANSQETAETELHIQAPPEDVPTGALQPETLKEMFEARVVIHQALHLPMVIDHQKQQEWCPCTYVTVHPHPSVENIATGIIPNTQKPIWEHQCVTHVPNLYLQSQCAGLEFQVWSKLRQDTVENKQGDSYIGCAHVDLSPLAYGLSQISGWYNILDFAGQIQGQLKVSVIPSQRISFPSNMLLPPVHLSTSVGTRELNLSCQSHEQQLPAFGHLEGQQCEEYSGSKTSSMLFRQLRKNIQELDKVHQTLQAKLREVEDASLPSGHGDTTPQSHLWVMAPTSLTSPDRRTGELRNGLTHETSFSVPDSMKDQTHVHSHATSASNTEQQPTDLRRLVHSCVHPQSVAALPILSPTPPPPASHNSSGRHSPCSSEQLHESGRHSPCSSEQLHESGRHSPCSSEQLHESGRHSPCSSEQVPQDMLLHETGSQKSFDSPSSSTSLTNISACSSQNDSHLASGNSHGDELPIGSEHSEVLEQSLGSHTSDGSSHTSSPIPLVDSPHSSLYKEEEITHPEDLCSSPEVPLQPLRSQPYKVVSDEPCVLVVPDKDSHRTAQPPIPTLESSEDILQEPPTSSHPMEAKAHSSQGGPSSGYTPGIRLPNFFMPPHELEQSMRTLRASALSRPPPRRLLQVDRTASSRTNPECDSTRTFQTVHEYLESRRTANSQRQRPKELSTEETQRIARIFSLKPVHE